jgi:hypothetical protein
LFSDAEIAPELTQIITVWPELLAEMAQGKSSWLRERLEHYTFMIKE